MFHMYDAASPPFSFSYWSIKLCFHTEEKLVAVLIIPSSWGFPTDPMRYHGCLYRYYPIDWKLRANHDVSHVRRSLPAIFAAARCAGRHPIFVMEVLKVETFVRKVVMPNRNSHRISRYVFRCECV
jgi:hypothetical protein